MAKATGMLLLVLLQTASHALGQSNEHPYFDFDEYTFSVYENHNKSLPILVNSLYATDPEGDPITYTIPENGLGSDDFDIVNLTDGCNLYFKDTVNLDRETQDVYRVVVEANDGIDHGDVDHPSTAIVVIRLLDINDETPKFQNLPKTVQIFESALDGSTIYNVHTTDDDTGKNGQVRYEKSSVVPFSGYDKFLIGISSGVVSLSGMLDYENETKYEIYVKAEDKGDQPLSATEKLTVEVVDVNDNPPKFYQEMYSKQIYESLSDGSFVLEVEAFDQDRMIDDEIIYSIESINPSATLFIIDNITGSIYVNGTLDADAGSPQIYTLSILGEELTSDRSAKSTVVITVLDVNDNPPKFEYPSYNKTLSELSNIGTTVLTVKATDDDQGSNAEFTFHLVNLLSTPFPFNISQSSDGELGHIELADVLDFEVTKQYKFEVIATEIVENRTKTASTVVTVSVSNANDHFPMFDKSEYFVNISESAHINSFVAQVVAEDADEGTYGVVHYYLVNHLNIFEINETTGRITLAETVNYENIQSYSLTVAANDSAISRSDQLRTQVQVHIQVLDANDNGPIITANESEVIKMIEEQQEAGVLVYVIEANDEDDPPNDELYYFIDVLEPAGFTMTHFEYSDTAKNQLITSVMLDREDIEKYKLRACVSDVGYLVQENVGSGSNQSQTTVDDLPAEHVDCINIIVDVVDENDNPPIFFDGRTSYSFDIVEEKPPQSFVGSVNATDADIGLYGTVRYSLSGVDHENFTIYEENGTIVTAGPINREKKDRFDLIITAYDLDAVNSLSATASLTITVLDINDNVPKFSQPIYVENDIVENSLTVAIQVSADDADIDENDDLVYSIIGGNLDNQFIIDSATGLITLNSTVSLDRERNPEFELIIQVKDSGTTPLSSNATVFIDIQDQNDEKPVFDNSTYYVNVAEGTVIGSQILIVSAEDLDEGANGVVRYSIHGDDAQFFTIELMSGIIKTKKDFDYDGLDKLTYTFQVMAIDNAESDPKSSFATVKVEILDVNDNPPVFSKVQYSTSVYESLSGGSLITSVKASDLDDGLNKEITYVVSNVTVIGTSVATEEKADDTDGLFTLNNSTGELFLSIGRSLDYESVTGYNVFVEARDGGYPSKTDSSVIQVTILDSNDNGPSLSDSSYSLVIDEDTDTGMTFSIFSYNDEDSGDNAIATYTIDTNVFQIDAETGVLTLTSSLNFEESDYFEFEVTVTDGSFSDSATVNVTVVDVNDNKPIFQMPPHPTIAMVELNESNYTYPLNLSLYTFNATDDDDDLNSIVEYEITSGDLALFSIDSDTGQFQVIGVIDRESHDSYEVTVTATDGGIPRMSSTAVIVITVLDVNEEPPLFTAESYSYTIAENNAVNTSLVTVEADDQDLGNNAKITFTVNDTANFSITNDGVISANTVFDYESPLKIIPVLVTATDGGGLYSTVIFTLTITDKNDNKPKFRNFFPDPILLAENETINYEVVVSDATDDDSGANGEVTYQLSGAQGKFAIDSNGIVTLQSSLDRESTANYYLVVIASDDGLDSKTSTNEINVTVTDINDEMPVFDPTFYSIEVPENESLTSTLVTVFASDKDQNENSEIVFEIIGGNTENIFSIETTSSANNAYNGHIILDKHLDYEMETSYSLNIRASDKGADPQTSTAYVSIKVQNINDENPVFSPSSSYVFSVSEIAGIGTPVGTIYATDDDIGNFGKIASYSFAPDTAKLVISNFDISMLTGVISLSNTSNLDYENGNKSYSFSVVATDGGGLTSTSSVIVNVLGYNEEAPVFQNTSYYGSVYENQGSDLSITKVMATDPDNAQITYSITEGNDNGNFKVDTFGNILTAKSLNREFKEIYVLRVEASDGDFSGFTQVEVTVLDVNDNRPKFPSENVEYQLVETSTGITLTPMYAATDLDKNENSEITYSASGDGIPDVFSVNSTTGSIELVGNLNYELKTTYKFTVFAEDGGSDPLSGNITIEIEVLDYNDNAPMFESNLYSKFISESIVKGSPVISVFANDSDSGSNAEVVYSIDNESDKFEINSDGEILTKDLLNYELKFSYMLNVIARDKGTPQKSTSTTVNVTLIDENDNFPMFDESSYSHSVTEQDVQSDLFLLNIGAIDEDGTSPNNLISYNITDGNSDMKFRINTDDGNLYAIDSLDYEVTTEYVLTITAKDNPTDPDDEKYNTTKVTILINDANDNFPVWKENIYRVTLNEFAGTVREDASPGTSVLFVEATDEDSGSFGTVTYSFISQSGKFYINETSGIVYTKEKLSVLERSSYNLTIAAQDGGSQLTTGYLSIEVIDVNDQKPNFISSFFYREVKEDVDVSYSIATLTAFDIDSNSSELAYSIMDGNVGGFFKINESTGEVVVAKSLDRETEDEFLLSIFVTDGKYNDTTVLRVKVTDVNDNAPKFKGAPYFTDIEENTVSGGVLLFDMNGNTTYVQAEDADEVDTPNSIVVYEIFGKNADILSISPSTGVLTVSSGANLDYETLPTVVVNLRAQDSVDPPGTMSSETTITINVLDVNDKAPEFTKSAYAEAIYENLPNGTVVSEQNKIMAIDEDTGVGGFVTYSIVDANPSTNLKDFLIDNITGEVTLTGPLDREETNQVVLTIRATDGGPSTFLTAEVLLTVTILDVNDNNPEFNQSAYFQSIPEDIGISGYVTTVYANDVDANHGIVEYSLLNLNNIFHINPNTGGISTVSDLDYETDNRYTIEVEACDNGGQNKLCSTVNVSLQIRDINDNAPRFDYDTYYTTLCYDVAPVTDVLQLIAIDEDSGDFGTVTYTLASGSSLEDLFTLNSNTGLIKLVKKIPANKAGSKLTVEIIAADGGAPSMTEHTNVEILFCDPDIDSVYFNQSLYYGTILENEIPPAYVTTVEAIGLATYSILPLKNNSPFNISQNGVISTTVELDREKRMSYTLIVKAVDSEQPPNTAYTTISVAVLDVNDNPPLFLLTPYMFTLTEELMNTTIVDKVAATDPDRPLISNAVSYSIDSSSNPDGIFEIDQNGTIYAVKSVDRESTPEYKLTIQAKDAEPPDTRIGKATATITILDVNDNKPIFASTYENNIPENFPLNSMVLTVIATDDDIQSNSDIKYSIESGGDNKFIIDSSTGILSTSAPLDYEDVPLYNISIKAQDNGDVPQSSFTNVIIRIDDFNDCYPKFTNNSYFATLKEDFTPGFVLDINVTDCDSGKNKDVTFAIVAGNNDKKFVLDSTTGVLSLKNTLDYEDETSYSLQIRAIDGGTPALANLTQVYIAVDDVNDETPVFAQEKYELDVLEDRNEGFEILMVSASDDDASDINSNLEYSILDGNTNIDFEIDKTSGSIKVANELDRETTPNYEMTIGVKDTGSPPRSANATLSIKIIDVNDNPPMILNIPSGSSIHVLENATTHEELFIVNATDQDINENARLEFSLQNYNDIFSINPETGVVKLKTTLDYDEGEVEYQLSIEVTDLANDVSSRLTDHATLNVLIQDINDNDPVFAEDEYIVSRPEEENPGQVFTTVEATDNDGSIENNEITYILTECVPACLDSFNVNSSSGVITNVEKLDREMNSNYVLSIIGINLNAYPERNDTTVVNVTITDINDHAPKFAKSMYSVSTYEGVDPNTPVLTVAATDEDQPNTINTDLSYKFYSVIPNNPFSLNEESGLLEVTGNIDREDVSIYNFTITVEDNGETKLYDDVQVIINVNDRNDRPPVFNTKTQNVRVSEDANSFPLSLWTPGYTDDDGTPENTHSLYSILSVANGTTYLGSENSLISIDQETGEVFLTLNVDFEETKNLTVVLSISNTKDGTGDLCGGFQFNCSLSDTATLNIEVTDSNDNIPMFGMDRYTGQISTSSVPGAQIRQVVATDKDSQNNYGTLRYQLKEGSSTKFSVEAETGWVTSRGRFENDDGAEFRIQIEAYDNLGVDPSLSSSVEMTILALSDFRRVLVLFGIQFTEFTEAKEKFVVDTLHNLTGYTIIIEDIREHIDDDGDIDSSQVDFIFHAVDKNGQIVDFDDLLAVLDVNAFFDATAGCNPIRISPLQSEEDYPKVDTVMIYLIILCGIIAIGSIIVLVFACQQRYIALNSMWKSQMRDAFYGAADPSLIEGTVPRDFSGETFEMRRTTKSPLYVEPYNNFGGLDSSAIGGSSIGDLDSLQQGNPIYEDRELQMHMFELSDDEETVGDADDDHLLAEALKDDDDESGSVTAI